jgi:hypothetical protein
MRPAGVLEHSAGLTNAKECNSMAKVETKPTPARAWARDFYPGILEICGSPQYCGPWVVKEIAARRMQWWCKATCPPNEPLDDFWQGSPPSIDFENNTATKLVVHPTEATLVSITLLGLQFAHEDIATKSKTPAEPEPTTAQGWIAAEARRMKIADEIPATITGFARALEKRMTAARHNRPVGWKYIKNNLPKWGLWPKSEIKI